MLRKLPCHSHACPPLEGKWESICIKEFGFPFFIAYVLKNIYYFLLAVIVIAGLLLFSRNFNTPFQQFSLQSQSFLQGKLDIPAQSIDTVVVNGKHYWPQGPFPS